MALWLKPHVHVTGGLGEYYISSGGQTVHSMGITLHQMRAGLHVSFRTESKTWSATVSDFEIQLWYHVVLAWTEERGLEVYLDGCLRQTGGSKDFVNNRNPSFNDFVFGNANSVLDDGSRTGEMTLDEVRVWDADMDGEDVWKIYVADIMPWWLASQQSISHMGK